MEEKILENKSCKKCSQSFPIYQEDRDFYEKISPSFGGEKFQIPDPTLCPECRRQRRLSFQNRRKLYRNTCAATGKSIISMYRPDNGYTVYSSDFWWGDTWEALNYGREFNFGKSTFKQIGEVLKDTPKRSLIMGTGSENCEYVNFVGSSKNCYLIFDTTNGVDSYYSELLVDSQDCMDSLVIRNSNSCYECVDVLDCFYCFYVQNSQSCSNSQYLYNCKNCANCFACVSLENKSYCIYNKQYSKQEYFDKLKVLQSSSDIMEEFTRFKLSFPVKNLQIVNSENATGDVIHNSKNVKKSYEVFDGENVSYCVNIFRGTKDCFDVYAGLNDSFLLYDSCTINKNCSNILFCIECHENCSHLLYCTECKSCTHCFGCYGLRNKQYCILNKQYTKQEYEKLVSKIIEKMKKDGEWGEFFPVSLSPFGYNETVAGEHFPLTKNDAEEKGFHWSDYEPPFPKVDKIIPANKLPTSIEDIPDDIINWAIKCENSGQPFRIVPQELEFYRRHNLPVPRLHPEERHRLRLQKRNPMKLHERNCEKCQKPMQTSYASKRPEIVYCEECYNKEIYG